MLSTMSPEFGIGNTGILLKVLKATAHGERGKGCLRQQFNGYRRCSGMLFS